MPPITMPSRTHKAAAVSPRPSHDAVAKLCEPRILYLAPPLNLTEGWYSPVKFIVEFIAAALLLFVVTPIILLIALLVKLTSRGPVFYSQTRLGKNGQPFWIHKIRT